MLGMLVASVLVLGACAATSPARPVRLVPGDSRPISIESTVVASDGRSAEVRVVAPRGVFAVDLDFSDEGAGRLERLVLVVAGERFCEGLEAEVTDTAGGPDRIVELRDHEGVAIGRASCRERVWIPV